MRHVLVINANPDPAPEHLSGAFARAYTEGAEAAGASEAGCGEMNFCIAAGSGAAIAGERHAAHPMQTPSAIIHARAPVRTCPALTRRANALMEIPSRMSSPFREIASELETLQARPLRLSRKD